MQINVIIYALTFLITAFSVMSLAYNGPTLLFLRFLIIPVVLASKFRLRKATFVICLLGTLLILTVSYFDKNCWGCILTVALLNLMPFFMESLNKQLDLKKARLDKEMKDARLDYFKVEDQLQVVDEYNKNMEQRYNEISSLYEIMKDMAASLVFSDIYKILNDFVKKKFFFRRIKLVLSLQDREGVKRYRAYQIAGSYSVEELAVETKIDDIDLKLFEFFNKGIRNSLFYIRPDHDSEMSKLNVPPYIKTFLAIPLIIENKIVGLLTGEDFQMEEFEKISILSGEVALEIKKVLLYETVQEMAIMDGLTNIYVRRHFLERFSEEMDRAKGHSLNMAFVMVDVDNFKSYNDTYGHLVGDAVLKEIANILKNNIREIDLVGRYGGEEFSVILSETNKDGAYQFGERIRQIIESYTFKAYDEALRLTISVGISSYPDDGTTMNILIDRADMALYEAKQKGKNNVVMYNTAQKG